MAVGIKHWVIDPEARRQGLHAQTLKKEIQKETVQIRGSLFRAWMSSGVEGQVEDRLTPFLKEQGLTEDELIVAKNLLVHFIYNHLSFTLATHKKGRSVQATLEYLISLVEGEIPPKVAKRVLAEYEKQGILHSDIVKHIKKHYVKSYRTSFRNPISFFLGKSFFDEFKEFLRGSLGIKFVNIPYDKEKHACEFKVRCKNPLSEFLKYLKRNKVEEGKKYLAEALKEKFPINIKKSEENAEKQRRILQAIINAITKMNELPIQVKYEISRELYGIIDDIKQGVSKMGIFDRVHNLVEDEIANSAQCIEKCMENKEVSGVSDTLTKQNQPQETQKTSNVFSSFIEELGRILVPAIVDYLKGLQQEQQKQQAEEQVQIKAKQKDTKRRKRQTKQGMQETSAKNQKKSSTSKGKKNKSKKQKKHKQQGKQKVVAKKTSQLLRQDTKDAYKKTKKKGEEKKKKDVNGGKRQIAQNAKKAEKTKKQPQTTSISSVEELLLTEHNVQNREKTEFEQVEGTVVNSPLV